MSNAGPGLAFEQPIYELEQELDSLESEQAGNGQEGESDSPNKEFDDAGKGKKEARTIGKKAGKAGSHLPPEFQKALDAYNKSR